MPEVYFFFSADDESVALQALRLGYSLLVNRDYGVDEDLLVLSADSDQEVCSFRRFFVLPDSGHVPEISLGTGTRKDGETFRYIMDRVGAAAIDLILYRPPSEWEVSVGSLSFQAQTHPVADKPLDLRPAIFSDAFHALRSHIKKSARPVPNGKVPRTVHVFPKALELLREDFSRTPWPSLRMAR